MLGGGPCPASTQQATFVLTIPTLTRIYPPLEEPPNSTKVDRKPSLQSRLHRAKWRISTSMCFTHVLANKQFVPISVGINTFITITLPALTTTCDGGVLLTTQGTHICLIMSLILRGGQVAFITPNMRRDIVPWSLRRVTDLPPNAKLYEMQQNTHGLVQLIRAATLDVPNQTPMPQLSKQMLNACHPCICIPYHPCIPSMHIIVRLLLGHQNSVLSSNEWNNESGLDAPSWPPTSKSRKSPWVRDGPSQMGTSADVLGAKGQIHTMSPNISTATMTLKTCDAYLGF